ncbi:hypothetical protein NEF87_001859 [Candidatus Lokiarchaeum ossiferum]|uniref:Uncharacterized protein n=1 Tax=Candidatus Lokiarchaeum ossiferum TaxID=2951803 RepID=A0ABY6HSN0_9ARCH|nr:hypothetical protein NEF87_001859 [Candidatus Lokiarchaeum sp. B-35]
MTKKKIYQKSFSDNPYGFQFEINSRKQLIILHEIWKNYLIIKKKVPKEEQQQKFEELNKLTFLILDPRSSVILPYLNPRNSVQSPMEGIELSVMKFPKMGNFRLKNYFKEFEALIIQTSAKNKEKTSQLTQIFIQKLWDSVLFSSKNDPYFIINSFGHYFKTHDFEHKMKALDTQEKFDCFITSQEESINEIQEFIIAQIHSFSPNSEKPRKSFRMIHKEVKLLFELYGYLIGFIRGLFDIIGENFDSKLENYMDRKYNIVYGMPNKNSRKSEQRATAFTRELRKSVSNPTIRYLIDKMVFGKLRPLQNSVSPPPPREEMSSEHIYTVENKKQEYVQNFTLSEFWVLKSNLAIFLHLCFNYFFYYCPDNQTGKLIKTHLVSHDALE